ncbi:MAG: phosphotransferase family protein [Alphaproteobacteria bacterium]
MTTGKDDPQPVQADAGAAAPGATDVSGLPDPVRDSLIAGGLLPADRRYRSRRLTGGVSSDIWLVETPDRSFCVKRALSQLRVAADWHAPVDRNRFEVAWCRIANELVPGSAPEILYLDSDRMLCAMGYLDHATHRLWKDELHAGRVRTEDARAMGQRLGRIHAGAAGRSDVAAAFPNEGFFAALRLEPYLEATAGRHPDLAETLMDLSRRTDRTRVTMIHGDVSPKNIMIGPGGPVLLDAECACVGDPAFDLAFCLNHLLLKCLWTPAAAGALLTSFDAMAAAYIEQITWEEPAALEQRSASLLPGLLLARVDGKSPVEYLSEESDKAYVRDQARHFLEEAPTRLDQIRQAWGQGLAA